MKRKSTFRSILHLQFHLHLALKLRSANRCHRVEVMSGTTADLLTNQPTGRLRCVHCHAIWVSQRQKNQHAVTACSTFPVRIQL